MPIQIVATLTGNAAQELGRIGEAAQRLGATTRTVSSGLDQSGQRLAFFADGATRARVATTALNDGLQTVGTRARVADAGFGSLIGNVTRATAAFTGVNLGIQGVQTVLGGTLRAMTSFETSLANTFALGIRSAEAQDRLRQGIQAIRPELGTTTELANGLFTVTSAGVPAAESLGFLARNAAFARAGSASLETAVTATTKVMEGFGISTRRVNEVTDILFQTVNVGQGTLEQFAGAFPIVAQQASAAGVSVVDMSAALAALSASFQSPSAAATGLRSLLGQLIQNADEFASRGVNIREVIGQRGLTGVLEVLRQVTHGNVEELRTFVNDIEGQQAALALLGPAATKFADAQRQIGNATGAVSFGLREQLKPLQAQWTTFVNTLERGAQQVAPVVTGSLTALLGGFTVLGVGVGALIGQLTRLTQVPIEGTLDLFARASGTNLAALDAAAAAAKTRADEAQARLLAIREAARATGMELTQQTAQGLNLSAAAIKEHQARTQALANAYLGLRTTTLEALREQANGAAANFALIEASGREPPQRLRALWLETRKQLIEAYGSLPPQFAATDQRILTQVDATVAGLRQAWQTLGLPSPEERNRLGAETIAAFTAIADGGGYSAEQVRQAFEKALPFIIEQYGALPPRFAAVDQRLRTQVDTSVEGIRAAYTRLRIQSTEDIQRGVDQQITAFLALVPAVGAIPPQVAHVWPQIRDTAIETYGELPERLRGIGDRIVGQVDNTTRGAQAAYKRLGLQSAEELKRSTDEQIAAIKRLVPSTGEVTDQIRQRYLELRPAILLIYGGIPEGIREFDKRILESSDTTTKGIQSLYQRLRVRTTEELTRMADDAATEFSKIRATGDVSAQELVRVWTQETLPKINQAGFRTLPPSAQAAYNELLAATRAAGIAFDAAWIPKIRGVAAALASVPAASDQANIQTLNSANRGSAAYLQAWNALRPEIRDRLFGALPPAADAAHGSVVDNARRASGAYAQAWRQGIDDVRDDLESIASQSAAALHDIRITTETRFSDTIAGLQEQLRQVQQTTQRLAGGTFGGAAVSFAGRDALLQRQREIENAIRARIAALQQQQQQREQQQQTSSATTQRPPTTQTPSQGSGGETGRGGQTTQGSQGSQGSGSSGRSPSSQTTSTTTTTRTPTAAEQQREVNAAVQAFQRLLPQTGAIPVELAAQWEELRARIVEAYGALPATFQALDARLLLQVDTTTRGVTASYERLGIQTTAEAQRAATQQVVAFQQVLSDGGRVTDELREQWQRLRGEIVAAYGRLPQEFRQIDVLVLGPAAETTQTLNTLYQQFGVQTREQIQQTAIQAAADFATIANAGQVRGQDLLRIWNDEVFPQLRDAGFSSLPGAANQAHEAIVAAAARDGVAYVDMWNGFIDEVIGRFRAANGQIAPNQISNPFVPVAPAPITVVPGNAPGTQRGPTSPGDQPLTSRGSFGQPLGPGSTLGSVSTGGGNVGGGGGTPSGFTGGGLGLTRPPGGTQIGTGGLGVPPGVLGPANDSVDPTRQPPVGGVNLSNAQPRSFTVGGITIQTAARDADEIVREIAAALRQAWTRGDLDPHLPGVSVL